MGKLDHEVSAEDAIKMLSDIEVIVASQFIKGASKKITYDLWGGSFVVKVEKSNTTSEHCFDSISEAVDCYNNQ